MTPQEKLKALRKQRNLTTQELGDLCGMLQSTISKLENGKRKMSLETLSILAKALNVSVSYFLEDEGAVVEESLNCEGKQELLQSGINILRDEKNKKAVNGEVDLTKGDKDFSKVKEDINIEDDITEELNILMQKFYSNKGGPLFFNGAPLDGEALEELEESLKFAIRGLKQKNLKRRQLEEKQ